MRLFKNLLLCLLLLQLIICMPETGSRAKSLSAGKWEKGRKFHVPIKESGLDSMDQRNGAMAEGVSEFALGECDALFMEVSYQVTERQTGSFDFLAFIRHCA